ncbi:hypothetical protein NR800_12370 [Corallococcus interemptor]|uniref:hypothetical protein n=1 Tax=Corallococcus TaxID=83461 RepID=UPI001A90482A|nr:MULTISPECIES: hypothetical protein [unclassified Corallococcus]MBN9684570.1 hypothetical protein [Corallococcus sp. NCSPR001]MBZ4332899.1 hypothetical protein [Corallococcus sp. AS-1-12]MBZ4372459.1 hypothetical protein [Corallococcus sp. AS-1-6]WAS83957.1 hypothetical protein O0N60_32225 [Corallococcus sp. NCRR]
MPGNNTTQGQRAMMTVLDAPLPELIERLGRAVADAQHALDVNSLDIAKRMSERTVDLGDGQLWSLLALGFTPTFYAFAEATLEAKLTFTIRESTEFSVGGGATGGMAGIFSVTVNAEYSRKYGFEVQGASSIAARLVSLPPPARLHQLLNEIAAQPPLPAASTNTSA